jgi:uncharacterized membrane protein YkoI
MKAIILLATAISFAASSCGQNIPTSKVPSVVQNTVQTKFANAVKIEWERKEKLYEAEFKIDKTEHSVLVDEAGTLISTKTDIEVARLPAEITAAIAKDYAGYTVDDAEKIDKDGVTYYQVELEGKGKEDKELIFTSTGETTKAISYIN